MVFNSVKPKLRFKKTHFPRYYSRYIGLCCQTPTTHTISTIEPLYVISIKYSSSLPDDGSYVTRNMLEYFNVYLLDFCIIQILTSTIFIIERISWFIKVTFELLLTGERQPNQWHFLQIATTK